MIELIILFASESSGKSAAKLPNRISNATRTTAVTQYVFIAVRLTKKKKRKNKLQIKLKEQLRVKERENNRSYNKEITLFVLLKLT